MKHSYRRPTPERLREMAGSSHDPIIRRALRDLADEYERMNREQERILA
jgi:hypothetical protein